MVVLSLLFGIVFGLLGPAIGFIIVAVKAHGRPRSLGMLGFAIAGAIGIVTQIANRMLPTIMYRLNLSVTVLTTVWSLAAAVIGLVPLIVLAIAISANRSTATGTGYPYGQYQAPQPGGTQPGGTQPGGPQPGGQQPR